MYLDPSHGKVLRIYNIVLGSMIYGYGLRKREHVLRATDGSAKQDVRATRTLGVKFPGIAPSRPGEELCCGNKDIYRAVLCRVHAHRQYIDRR